MCACVCVCACARELAMLGVAQLLNAMYSEFDAVAHAHALFRVETLGDAYMVSFVPVAGA